MDSWKTHVPSPGRKVATVAAVAAVLAGMAWYVSRKTRDADREAPPQGRFVEVDGVRLHVVERGEGPPVVLLHGNGSRIEEVESSGLVDRLARKHRVLLIDRPGFGHTDRPRGRDFGVAAQARLFARALDVLGVDRAIIVGHSWGTLVGLAMALDRPDRVAGLVLASGYYYPTFRPDFLLASITAWPVIGTLMRHTTTPVAGRVMWRRALRQLFRPHAPTEGMRSITPWAFLRPHSLRSQAEEGGVLMGEAAKLAHRYAEVRVPVTILAGARDPFIPPERHSQRLHAAIEGSRFRCLPDAGHMLHHDDPDAVAAAIDDLTSRSTERPGVARALVPEAAALLPQEDAAIRATP